MDATEARLRVLVDDIHVSYRVRPHGGMAPRSPVKVEAVRGVSFELHEGESVGIIGRNGAGKSTLLRAIAGLLPVDHGAVYATSTPVLLGVGKTLMPKLSGRENVMLGCLALGMSLAEAKARLEDIVDFSGLDASIDLPLASYSSGMAARLKFAIASAVEQEILLLDEALATGDLDFKERSIVRMHELRSRAKVVVLVSHSLSSVRESCSRVIWLHQGSIRQDGPPEEVLEAYVEDTRRRRKRRRAARTGESGE